MGASVRLFICLVFLLNLFTTLSLADKADAGSSRVAAETAFLATETEGHELIRLAYSEGLATKAGPTGDDSLSEARRPGDSDEDSVGSDPWEDEGEEIDPIYDPLEPMNRAFFVFNDKLYFWVLKPVATGYKTVVPQLARVCIRNFFSNLVMPVRAISCLLQGKFEGLSRILSCCHQMHYGSLNMTFLTNIKRKGHLWAQARIMPRISIPPLGISDVNYFEKGHSEVITVITPEEFAEQIRRLL